MDVERDVDEIDRDPEPPVGNPFPRQHELSNKAHSCGERVPSGDRGVGVGTKHPLQEGCNQHDRNAAGGKLPGFRVGDFDTGLFCAATQPPEPAHTSEAKVDDLKSGIGVEARPDKEDEEQNIVHHADREVPDAPFNDQPDAKRACHEACDFGPVHIKTHLRPCINSSARFSRTSGSPWTSIHGVSFCVRMSRRRCCSL